VLRSLIADDAPTLFRIRSDARVMQHIGLPRALDMKDAEELIERVLIELRENNGITCAKILESDDTLIGTIGYYRLQKTHH